MGTQKQVNIQPRPNPSFLRALGPPNTDGSPRPLVPSSNQRHGHPSFVTFVAWKHEKRLGFEQRNRPLLCAGCTSQLDPGVIVNA